MSKNSENSVKSSKSNIVSLNVEPAHSRRFDGIKWVFASFLLVLGIVANHYYGDIARVYRVLAWLTIVLIAGLIVVGTYKGKQLLQFFNDSRMELRKVVWPTREETMQTTLVVAVMVTILALILWGMDGVLVWLVGWLTGQRG